MSIVPKQCVSKFTEASRGLRCYCTPLVDIGILPLLLEYASASLCGYYNFSATGWHDIGYNFLIGGDGVIYEGAGWDSVGAHALGYNSQSIGICFIGDFTNRLPNHASRLAAQRLISCGVSMVSHFVFLMQPSH